MTVLFYSDINKYTNGEKSYIPGNEDNSIATLQELLDRLFFRYGKGFEDFIKAGETCLILVNGNGVKLTGGLNTQLKPGDKIEFLPFVTAG